MSILEFIAKLLSLQNPLWFYYLLCLVVGVVYKMTKFDRPREIIHASLHFFVSVTLGVIALAVVLYLVAEFL
ncbi:MAG: hypothetical protein QF662_04165 [Phycisphaerae bacterium]|jgi:hypothetical protein|nr:hypothetical protein [Phycisphaerae bacterium]